MEQSSQSPRLRLAALTRETALSVPGVLDLDSGATGLFVTVGGGVPVAGVRCLAAPGGGFDLALRLVCELVDLVALGERVRDAVLAAASSEGFEVSTVAIEIADVTVA